MFDAFFDEVIKHTPKKSRNRNRSKSVEVANTQGLEPRDPVWHMVLFSCLLFGILLVFVARVIDIQVLERDKYLSLARENRIRNIPIQAERGVIYDTKENILVRNKPAFSLELNTQFCELNQCEDVIRRVNDVVEINLEDAVNDVKSGKSVVILADGLDKESILPLEASIKNYPGVVVVTQPIRDYLFGELFAHVVGYVGWDEESQVPLIVGKQGIEEYYNNDLSGIPGALVIQMDSAGTEYSIIAQEGSLPGKSVHMYLDVGLQQKAFEVLKNVVEKTEGNAAPDSEADAGVIVAQDPKTGGILAMVSYPTFEPNLLVSGLSSSEFEQMANDPRFPFFNRAVGAAYPPGSTFKMVVASAALAEEVVTENTVIFDPGFIQVGSYIFRNWKLDGHGDVNMRRAIQVSNDTYFYTVGGRLGIGKLSSWAQKFGFGSLAGVDILGEVPGYMPDGTSREWYLGDTYITSIGQGDVLATPLQVNNMVVYFANGGFLLVPRVVKYIDGIGDTEVQVIGQNLVDSEIYDIIRDGMYMAVESGGTGWPFFDFEQVHGVRVAGKTGTSEYIDRDGTERTHAWFSVFEPSEIVLTVFLEGGGGGSNEAAPVAREVMDYWFSR
ncbi:penicillin-binding protein 2 [bacterium]|nr:penicillin-binding protein 2 [bacterium]